jgi:hypothetical protein
VLSSCGYELPPFRRSLVNFPPTSNAESHKLTGAHTSSAAASSETFLLVLLLTIRAGSHTGDLPPVVGCGRGGADVLSSTR